ncbi:MAG: D-glycerate dehydrogenase [Melioribacteraceae bacterium]|nr:D-glycerate dehydrogenase [Melioribacteraceae bacterium]
MKVFITRSLPGNVEKTLRENGHTVVTFKKDKPITKKELIKYARNAGAVISLLTDKIDSEIIDNLKKCKIIANYAAGYNNIDINYAKQKNIIVTNTPDILTNATADIALTLALACSRRAIEGHDFVMKKKFKGWAPNLLLGLEMSGKTIGIIGAGRIGQAVAKRFKAFDTKIIYYNRSSKYDLEKDVGAKKVSLKKLMNDSDIISIQIPSTNETYHLLDKEHLSLLKPNAILINIARGEVVDEKYLIQLLKKGKIHSAGFDVYENEPNLDQDLLKLSNAVLLPHLGSATIETRTKMAQLCAENVIRVLSGRTPKTPV